MSRYKQRNKKPVANLRVEKRKGFIILTENETTDEKLREIIFPVVKSCDEIHFHAAPCIRDRAMKVLAEAKAMFG